MNRTRRIWLWLSALVLAACALVFAGPLIAQAVGAAAGCAVNAGGAQPCVMLGIDWGGVLHALFMLGAFWVPLAFLAPLAAAALILLLIAALGRNPQRSA